MTALSNTAKMIYETPAVANMILGKLVKRNPDKKFVMMKVDTGWQVAPVQVMPSGMPPAKPAPVLSGQLFGKPTNFASDALTFEFPFQRSTKAWLYFDGGNVKWLHRNKVISYDIIEQPGETMMIRFRVSPKVAKEAGLPAEGNVQC